MRRVALVAAILVVLALCVVATAAFMRVPLLAPAQAALHYPWGMLAQEANTMNDCVECHEPEEFHSCATCHDDHGSAEMELVPFSGLLLLLGDVPEPGYIPINDILPYRDQPNTHVALLDFLAERGVIDWESVTLASRDEGFVTIEQPYVTSEGLLMPFADGVRFADENLHVSSWLKGVWRIIVVGSEKPLTIDGQATSIGRLLLGPTKLVTVEQTDTMLKSETDGQVRTAKTASRIEGAPIEAIVAEPGFQTLVVRDQNGQERTLTAEEAAGAVLAQVQGRVTLVMPHRGRAQWVSDVVEITSQMSVGAVGEPPSAAMAR